MIQRTRLWAGTVLLGASGLLTLGTGSSSEASTCEAIPGSGSKAWLGSDSAQNAVDAVGAALTKRFGSSDKSGRLLPLQNGLVGVALDSSTQTYVAVVDPSVDQRTLLTALNNASSASSSQAGGPPFRIDVRAACTPAANLQDVWAVVSAHSWDENAASSRMLASVDPYTSTIAVTLDPDHTQSGAALVARFGNLVSVDYSYLGRTGRADDVKPYYGGDEIRHVYGPTTKPECSSGFGVQLANGDYASVTAAHCPINQVNGVDYHLTVSDDLYGSTAGISGYPTWDMAKLTLPNDNRGFTYAIFTSPNDPSQSVRTVDGGHDPSIGDAVCNGGYVTGGRCGMTVTGTDAQYCDGGGCTTDLIKWTRDDGGVTGGGGDSGGPLYSPETGGYADIRGMVIAGKQCDSNFENCLAGVAEKISQVRSHLNVTLLHV